MAQNFVLLAEVSDFSDRLNSSDLVVCMHDTNKSSVSTDRLLNNTWVDNALGIASNSRDADP